jgi:hypothetical protein
MKTTQGNTWQSLRAVQAFLTTNGEVLAGVGRTGTRKQLDSIIAELDMHVADQAGCYLVSQGETRQQRALRRALLRDHVAPLVRIAKANLPEAPQIEALRMPNRKLTTAKLGAAAHGMAQAAEPYSDVFIEAGLPDDFIAQLNSATDAMLETLTDRSNARGKRSGATKGIKERLTAGRKIVHVLDALVQSALQSEPALLAGWNSVKRVQKVAGRSASPMPMSTQAPTLTLIPSVATKPAMAALPRAVATMFVARLLSVRS